jgi:hypothetical protein
LTGSRTLELAGRLVLAWLVVSLLVAFLGHRLIALLLPFFTVVVALALPDTVPSLAVVLRDHEYLLTLSFWTTRPVELGDQAMLASFSRFENATTHVSHSLVPATILLVPLLAWRARTLTERMLRLLLGVPVLIAVLAATSPLLLAGRAEMMFLEMRLGHGAQPWTPPLVWWLIFLESGGRWLLAVIGAVGCLAAARRFGRDAAPS